MLASAALGLCMEFMLARGLKIYGQLSRHQVSIQSTKRQQVQCAPSVQVVCFVLCMTSAPSLLPLTAARPAAVLK